MRLPKRQVYYSALYSLKRTNDIRLLFLLLSVCIQVSFAQIPMPQFKSFQPIEQSVSPQFQQAPLFQPQRLSSLLPPDHTTRQNARIIEQANMNAKQTQADMQHSPNGGFADSDYNLYLYKSKRYLQYLDELLQMNPDNFSITKATYLVESAWYNDPEPFSKFEKQVQLYADVVKQLLKREGLDIHNNAVINYGVQKLYQQDNIYYDPASGKTMKVAKLSYDFNDYMGDKSLNSIFVTKLLKHGTGQCHSLPRLYLCIVEQLHGKAYLSLSPNHSFIQYFGNSGKRYNFETTNGNHVSDSWLLQSSFVSSVAFANKTYLDTLSSRQLYAQTISDLLVEYRDELGYSPITDAIIEKIQSIDAKNMAAMMEKATTARILFMMKQEELGYPPPEQWNKYPALVAAYNRGQEINRRIDATGHQEIPPEIYRQWIASMQQEKQKQQNKAENDQLLKELKKLKNVKPLFKNAPKQ